MKKKLGIAFTLIALSLIGIIVFQGYWTVNAYRVNKKQFDSDIDSAMLRAMDSCKRDYFDSIRIVMIKKLSTDYIIRIDTNTAPDPGNISYDIRVAHKSQESLMMVNAPFTMRALNLNYYKTKIKYTGRESIPALLTEMSFYVPTFLYQLTFAFQMEEMSSGMARFKAINRASYKADSALRAKQKAELQTIDPNPNPIQPRDSAFDRGLHDLFYKHNSGKHTPADDSLFKQQIKVLAAKHKAFLNSKQSPGALKLTVPPKPADTLLKHSINMMFKQERDSRMPPHFHQADSARIYKYFKKELVHINIIAPFKLTFVPKDQREKKVSELYSETTAFPYRYHGFDFLTPNITTINTTYTKAVFKSPQYAVMKSMLINLLFSALLIALTGFCFLYVYRTIVEQKKLAELKDDFINNMTHELKTPIATISVAIEGLQNFNALNDPEKTRRYLETSREQLTRLNQLVTKVLNIAAFEGKEVDLAVTPIKMDDLVNDIIRSEKAKATKTVSFSYANRDGIETITADVFHLRNVLHNLIDNAIKYSGDAVDIVITVYTEDNMACISVKDNGIGIAPADAAQVFDKFYRVPTGNIHNVKGTGLGLSYAKYIIEAHGGSIAVKSEPGNGAEFIIALPN
ncbi:sensor histidine kinase [Mucilaginibacter sp. AW1-3]